MLWLILLLFFVCVVLLTRMLVPAFRLRADRFLQQALQKVESDVDVVYLELEAKQVLLATVVSTLAALLFGLLLTDGVLLMGLMFGVAGYFLPKVYFRTQRIRRLHKLEDQLVTAIEMLSNALKAGTNLTKALAMIPAEMPPPISQEIALVLREMEVGRRLEEAMANLSRRVKSEEFDLVVTAINIARETGGNLAEVFDRIAKTIRERKEIIGKIKALTAEGKMQGIFVGLLPLFLGVVLTFLDPEMMKPMFTTTWGYFLLGCIVVLEVLGAFAIKHVLQVDV